MTQTNAPQKTLTQLNAQVQKQLKNVVAEQRKLVIALQQKQHQTTAPGILQTQAIQVIAAHQMTHAVTQLSRSVQN